MTGVPPDATGQDFVGTPVTYAISGDVTYAGSPLSGASVSDGAGHSVTSDASGNYTLSGLAAGTYTFTVSKSGYSFAPTSRTITVPPDATGQDFVGTAITYSVSGKVADGSGNPISSATVTDGAGRQRAHGQRQELTCSAGWRRARTP